MHGRHGVEDALTPLMAERLAGRADRIRRQNAGDFALDLRNGSEDTAGHPWPPGGMMFFTITILRRRSSFLALTRNPSSKGLLYRKLWLNFVPFVRVPFFPVKGCQI